MPKKGKPVQIVSKENGNTVFRLDELHRILLQSEVKDKEIVIFAIIGSRREGKSFLASVFLHKLHSDKIDDWFNEDTVLDYFDWSSGSEQVTEGIFIWSKPFFCKDNDGKEVVILFMDCQGSDDETSNPIDDLKIGCFAAFFSSVLIYNIKCPMREDVWQKLCTLMKIRMRFDENSSETTSYQKLLFALRDWSNPKEYSFGYEGGRKFIRKRLECIDAKSDKANEYREQIADVFKGDIECYLFDQPHKQLIVDKKDRRVGAMGKVFQSQVKEFVARELSTENSAERKIRLGAKCLTGEECWEFIQTFTKLIDECDSPSEDDFVDILQHRMILDSIGLAIKEFCAILENTEEDWTDSEFEQLRLETLEKLDTEIPFIREGVYDSQRQRFNNIMKVLFNLHRRLRKYEEKKEKKKSKNTDENENLDFLLNIAITLLRCSAPQLKRVGNHGPEISLAVEIVADAILILKSRKVLSNIKEIVETKRATAEDRSEWVSGKEVDLCMICEKTEFSLRFWKHHCRSCGCVVCAKCSSNSYPIDKLKKNPVRVCDYCYISLTVGSTRNSDGKQRKNTPSDSKN